MKECCKCSSLRIDIIAPEYTKALSKALGRRISEHRFCVGCGRNIIWFEEKTKGERDE